MGIVVQVIATVLLSVSCVNLGITFTWPSSTILLFKSENTTLHRPMKDIDITLFTSLPLLGTLVSQPLVVLGILDKLGLKRTTLLTSLLFTIAWSIIAVSNRVEAILLAATITGCGCVIFITVSMYISELVQDSIRGTLISVPNLSVSLGLVGSYLLGGLLEYYTMVYCYLSLAIFGVLAILFLKESPVYLMMKGREEEAVKSLAFYRQTSSTSKEILTEINNIRRSLNKDLEDTLSLTLVAEREMLSSGTERKSCWQLIKTCSSIRRQLYLAMVLYAAYVFQGLPSVQVYAVPIFTASVGEIVSPNVCSVVLGILILVTGSIAAYLIEKIGRRPLQLYGSIVCGFCCLFIGTQMLTQWFPNIMTLLFIYVFTIAHTAGSGTVPFVVIAEIFLPEVKSKLYMLTTEWGYLCAFGWMFIFSTVVQSFGFAPVFFFFSFACFATAVYFFYYLPETKGLPVYAIQTLFTNEIDK